MTEGHLDPWELPRGLDRNDVETIAVHPVACVFAQRTTTVDGKRVKCRPRYFAARIYTLADVHTGDTRPFTGWTYYALMRGDRARHYSPTCVFTGKHALHWAHAAEDMLNRVAAGGQPRDVIEEWRYSKEPPLLGWDGQHRGHTVTIDGVNVEIVGGWTRGVDNTPRASHNLAWVTMSGLDCRHRHDLVLHRALVDLESLHRDRKFPDDWWITTVHHVDGTTYSEGPQLLTQVVSIESEAARKFIANMTGDRKWMQMN